MKRIPKLLSFLVPYSFCLVACSTIDLYEKSVAIPGHNWKSEFKPTFTFTIKDTSSNYQLYLVLRHNDKYHYRNIYIDLSIKLPATDSIQNIKKDLVLATDDQGWLGNGMDDIYEHRIPLGDPELLRAGDYTFTIGQIMREDPLKNVLNIGLRIEKKL